MRISNKISKKVVTIGPTFRPVAGGIAQVMEYYHDYVFDDFQFIANSCPGSKLTKAFCAVKAFAKLLNLLLVKDIEIAHIHTASKISFRRSVMFAKIGFLFKKKVIMHVHAGSFMDYYRTQPDYVAKYLKRCSKVIALSPVWKEQFEKEIGLTNVEIINNIVPPPVLDKNLAKGSAGCVHALFLGAIKKEKGIFDLVDMIAEHRDELQDEFVLHIGGNEQVDKLLQMIQVKHLESIVKFEGWVEQERKVALMNQCQLLYLPSYIEGLPICILEGMSYGMSIISTKIGGIPSIVEHGKNGFLLTPGDRGELWAATNRMVFDKEKRTDFGKRSLEIINSFYPENIIRQLVELYNNIL